VAGAALVFGGWEGAMAREYGESHFLYHLRHSGPAPPREAMIDLLSRMLGGLAPYITMFALAALRLPTIAVSAVAALTMVPYVLVCLAPRGSLPTASGDIFAALGLLQGVTLLVVVGGIVSKSDGGGPTPRRAGSWEAGCFLASWMILEVAGYFVMSPFPAVRRIMGLVVVETLVVGSFLSRINPFPDRRALVHGITCAGVGLGLLYYTVDYLEARAPKRAVEQVLQLPRANPRGTVWFTGHWGFQYYAEHAGMRPVVPWQSALRRGDWLAVPDRTIDQQGIQLDPAAARLIRPIEISDDVPLRTIPGFYDTGSAAFLRHQQGPRLTVQVYEVTSDFTP
ncbi:MAG: hypothetical protein ACP5XB_26805, partial [Isosphaeraceae bacterium]